MGKLDVRLLKHTKKAELDSYLRLYSRSFNPDERVSPRILRWVIQPSPARVNPVHLFAAYLDRQLGRLCYFNFRKPPERFSQPALLAYIHALFYGPEAMHRHLLPRLKQFVQLEA